MVNGEGHAEYAPLLIWHWNVLPPSVELNEKVGVVSLMVEPSVGPAVIDVFGAAVSTVTLSQPIA